MLEVVPPGDVYVGSKNHGKVLREIPAVEAKARAPAAKASFKTTLLRKRATYPGYFHNAVHFGELDRKLEKVAANRMWMHSLDEFLHVWSSHWHTNRSYGRRTGGEELIYQGSPRERQKAAEKISRELRLCPSKRKRAILEKRIERAGLEDVLINYSSVRLAAELLRRRSGAYPNPPVQETGPRRKFTPELGIHWVDANGNPCRPPRIARRRGI